MKTLAIDTSLPSGSVAALDEGRIAECRLAVPGDHARLLAAALDEVAQRLGWGVRDVELVAVVRGPGSFTGLRVGTATAKAIAWATGARIVGVSGFELIARATGGHPGFAAAPIEIAYDAGRGDVFAATAAPSPAGWEIGPAALQPLDRWIASLAAGAAVSGPALLLERCQEQLVARPDLRIAPQTAWLPSAADAGAAALLRAAAGTTDDPHALVPDYLRASYADERA